MLKVVWPQLTSPLVRNQIIWSTYKRTFSHQPQNNNNNSTKENNGKEERDECRQGGLGPEPNYQRVLSGYELYEHKHKVSYSLFALTIHYIDDTTFTKQLAHSFTPPHHSLTISLSHPSLFPRPHSSSTHSQSGCTRTGGHPAGVSVSL